MKAPKIPRLKAHKEYIFQKRKLIKFWKQKLFKLFFLDSAAFETSLETIDTIIDSAKKALSFFFPFFGLSHRLFLWRHGVPRKRGFVGTKERGTTTSSIRRLPKRLKTLARSLLL